MRLFNMPPDSLDNRDRIEHIYNECRFLLELMATITREELESDGVILRAICYSIVIIGEAGHHLSGEAKVALSEFEWKKAYQMRNFLVHQYDFIDLDIIWAAIEDDIPKLSDFLKSKNIA